MPCSQEVGGAATAQFGPVNPFTQLHVQLPVTPNADPPFAHSAPLAPVVHPPAVSQLAPPQPAVHEQVCEFTPSLHDPRPEQSCPTQSSMLFAHVAPSHPAVHSQVCVFTPSLHTPFPQSFPGQSSMLFAHVAPFHPALQLHVCVFTPSAHTPFPQSFPMQSLMLVVQSAPLHPALQMHVSLHTPFPHRSPMHSFQHEPKHGPSNCVHSSLHWVSQ